MMTPEMLDAALGRAVELVPALRSSARELANVDWSGGSCGAMSIDDAADTLDTLVAEVRRLRADAARWAALRHMAATSVGCGIEVNDDALVYETPAPGEEVRVYWYPNTPIGFNEAHGSTVDAAMDAVIGGAA